MVEWYGLITVKVEWENQLPNHICVTERHQTRQSLVPFLFNLIYQDVIEISLSR